MFLMLPPLSRAGTPQGFSWTNIESDQSTMAIVRRALHDPSITAIREVGVQEGFALVMTTSRESGAPTPDYDLWSIYNVSLSTAKSRILVSGYGMKLVDWIGTGGSELAITYYDCWECEPASLFTTLHFLQGIGWRTRWLPGKETKSEYPHPGAVVFVSDAGEPYEDDVQVDQVFAVVGLANHSFALGSWFHSRNTKTGKTEDDVQRYWVDPATGEDRQEQLNGSAALNWKREICTPSNGIVSPSIGQDSASCRGVLKNTSPHGKVSK
jgi:hypothetical protein